MASTSSIYCLGAVASVQFLTTENMPRITVTLCIVDYSGQRISKGYQTWGHQPTEFWCKAYESCKGGEPSHFVDVPTPLMGYGFVVDKSTADNAVEPVVLVLRFFILWIVDAVCVCVQWMRDLLVTFLTPDVLRSSTTEHGELCAAAHWLIALTTQTLESPALCSDLGNFVSDCRASERTSISIYFTDVIRPRDV